MSGFSRRIILAGLLAFAVRQAEAFTLMGPLATWQTVQLGYALNTTPFGGPVSLGEEYRWNVPTVYYAFTPDFLNYFGQKGVDEVEKAIKFFNDLPQASQLNIDDYPLSTQRENLRASALGLLDLKSFTMTELMNGLGLADPTRFVFTLRNRWLPVPGITNYFTIKRNFDPATLQHSSYINGQLWTYTTIIDNVTGAPDSLAVTAPVDPLALLGFVNAPVTSGNANGLLLLGGYWTGFTRDDVGGIKYIYNNNNYNVDNAPPNAFAGGGGGSPWGVPGTGTNAVFVSQALRPGVSKVQFVRANYDSLFGEFTPFTNNYTDTFVTNGATRTQGLQRPLQTADILFDAADLQGADNNGTYVTYAITQQAWVNNDALNGVAGQLGPGTIPPANGTAPSFILTYNTVGPIFFNQFPGFVDGEVSSGGRLFIWGSFDGSTNAPVVYPIGTSILDVEQQVLSGSGTGGGGPWAIPPIPTNITTTATGGGG